MSVDSPLVDPSDRHSRFEFAAPRHFLLPAVLLLVAEEPRHGYGLAKGLQELSLARVDRPSVYRALAQLERDGLVTASAGAPRARQARTTYAITEAGERALREWMGVIKDERDGLDRVLRRYVASESLEARVAEVAGGWQQITVPVFSPVSPSSRVERSRRTARRTEAFDTSAQTIGEPELSHFEVIPDRSVVLIDARSSVGPITFGALGVTGHLEIAMSGGRICEGTSPSAHLSLAVDQLRSGNGLYDAELMRRIESRRYPTVSLALSDCQPIGAGGRYRVFGDVDFHGTTRRLEGAVELTLHSEQSIVVRGEQSIDIRDFGVVSPTVLMLRIYPDVMVRIQIEAELRQ